MKKLLLIQLMNDRVSCTQLYDELYFDKGRLFMATAISATNGSLVWDKIRFKIFFFEPNMM